MSLAENDGGRSGEKVLEIAENLRKEKNSITENRRTWLLPSNYLSLT